MFEQLNTFYGEDREEQAIALSAASGESYHMTWVWAGQDPDGKPYCRVDALTTKEAAKNGWI